MGNEDKTLDKALRFSKQNYQNFISTKPIKFSEAIDKDEWSLKPNLKQQVKKKSGIYVIYKTGRPGALYVGSTSDLSNRIQWLFFQDKSGGFRHTLTNTLIKQKVVKDIDEAQQFYFSKCSFRYIVTENRAKATMLEGIFIEALRPLYNNEIIISYPVG